MKAKRMLIGLAVALAVAVGIGAPAPASADRGHSTHFRGTHRVVPGHFRPAWSHSHSRVVVVPQFSFGVWGGPGYWGYYPPYYASPYYYPPYYGSYYPPAVVSVPSSPPVYVERGSTGTAPEDAQSYWYYCAEFQGYYPYVKECPGGWQRVPPTPGPEPR